MAQLTKKQDILIYNISALAVGLATGIMMMPVIMSELNYNKYNTNLNDT